MVRDQWVRSVLVRCVISAQWFNYRESVVLMLVINAISIMRLFALYGRSKMCESSN